MNSNLVILFKLINIELKQLIYVYIYYRNSLTNRMKQNAIIF